MVLCKLYIIVMIKPCASFEHCLALNINPTECKTSRINKLKIDRTDLYNVMQKKELMHTARKTK